MSGNTKPKPMAEFYQHDANYFAERIGELHAHAMLHEGELCAKLNRARIGGMIEVLNRMHVEVDCRWEEYDRNVIVVNDIQWMQIKAAAKKLTN